VRVPSQILPGTGRGTAKRSLMVEGARDAFTTLFAACWSWGPSTTAFGGGPPPRAGEELL
jgi:hypothetical protein